MNAQRELAEALARIPGIDAESAGIQVLDGGLTNRSYLSRIDGRKCVLRLSGKCDYAIRPDRSFESTILGHAAKAGIAPAVVYADFEAGILVTEYLDGMVWQEADLRSKTNFESLAKLLRRVHALPLCGTRMDLTGMAERYARFIERGEGNQVFASNCVRIISECAAHESVTCCHNDIVAANVIDAGGLKLIDWEYACDNDPLFDLASAIGYHDFDNGRQRQLLDTYAGGADAEMKERLGEQVRVFDAIQWLWLAARHLASPQPAQRQRLEELRVRIR